MKNPFNTAALAATLFSLAAASAVHAADKPIQMEVNNWLASTAAATVGAWEPWKKLVEEKTQGRVKVNLYHGAVLGASKSVLEDVRGGVYHVGYAAATYYYDTPYFNLLIGELPFAIPDARVGAKVMDEFAKKYASGIFDKLGVKNMGVMTTDAYIMLSRKPIRSIDDVKNTRIRVPGKQWVQIIKDWGAVPTPMQPEDAYTALERGTIDTMYYSPSGSTGWKYNEVAPYVTLIRSPSIVMNLIMNKDFYNALPDDLKKMFDEELNPALIKLFSETYYKGANDSVAEMKAGFEKRGKGEVIELSPDALAKFVAPTRHSWDGWVAEANKRGEDGAKMMEGFKQIMRDNGLTPPF